MNGVQAARGGNVSKAATKLMGLVGGAPYGQERMGEEIHLKLDFEGKYLTNL